MAQPVIGPALSGTGRHWATQLALAVSFLKQANRPMRLEDLAFESNVQALLTNHELVHALATHDRVRHDPRTGLFSYRVPLPLSLSLPGPVHMLTLLAHPHRTQPDYLLSSKADLLALLRRHAPQGGLAVKKLRESWTGAQAAIEDLEREGRVLVTRTGKTESAEKDGQMKMVFLDDIGKERDPLDQGAPLLSLSLGMLGWSEPFGDVRRCD